MNLRGICYRFVCVLLGIYAILAAAGMAHWTGGRVFASGSLLFYTLAHAFLLSMATLRAARPRRTGTPGGMLLTLSLVLVVVAGTAIRLGPEWLPTIRLAVVAVGYLGLRVCAPRQPMREEEEA